MSTTPAWLPPLNSHDKQVTSVEIFQTGGFKEEPPNPPRLVMKIDASVKFFSDDINSTQKHFWGLSISQSWNIPYCCCLKSDCDGRHNCMCIGILLYDILSFVLEGDIVWLAKHLDKEVNTKFFHERYSHDGDDPPVYGQILNFLQMMIKKDYNKDKNVLTFNLMIEKRVTIPEEELASWNSWYHAKTRSNAGFREEFRRAISRPRTLEELISEDVGRRRKNLLKPSILLEALERVEVVESNPEMCCSICTEEFLLESQVIKLPCSHTFDEECLKKWLQESNTCPLCRCSL